MSTAIDFFKKYYKRDITEDELKNIVELDLTIKDIKSLPSGVFDKCVNLHTLDLSYNNLTDIHPNTFVNNVNLHTLYLSYNNLTVLEPNTFVNNLNLHTLYLFNNKLTDIHLNTFVNNVNLHTLYLSYNELSNLDPNTFVNNINLHILNLSYNKLTVLHLNTFVNNINLHTLNLRYNNLSSLPLEIINLRNLQKLYYNNNPIENIHPILIRFLDTIRNRATETNRCIYSDGQSVHNSAIQESVRNSIMSLLKDKDTIVATTINIKEDIINDDILTATTKSLILEYVEDVTTHSTLFVTFEDLLIKVWNRIKQHPQTVELKKILNEEMKGAECKCFTGRISRLVNVINGGYFDDIKITVSSSDQIANVILTIKEKLEKEGCYTPEKHREIAVKELIERGYESEIVKVWTDEI